MFVIETDGQNIPIPCKDKLMLIGVIQNTKFLEPALKIFF